MLLMLASTIRFSNHYQTPPTSSHEPVTTTWQVGPVSRNHTHTGFVIPGPNNVPVLAHRITRVVKAHTLTTLVG
jgi:hypothetical protein